MESIFVFVAFATVGFWALWCVLSRRVRDGVIGKLLYSAVALACFAGAVHKMSGTFSMIPYNTALCALALLAVRHIALNFYRTKKGKA